MWQLLIAKRRNWLRTTVAVAGMLFSLAAVIAGPPVPAAESGPQNVVPANVPPGQWWQYRQDRQLSGRSLIKGKIDHPAIRWSHAISGRETLLDATLAKGPPTVSLPAVDVPLSPEKLSTGQILMGWQVAGPNGVSWFDLDGNGQLTPVGRGYNQKIGTILPNQPGLQWVEAEAKGYPKVPGVYKGTVRMKVRQGGQWTAGWEIETATLVWVAEPIFGDFDADGRTEIALLPWFRLNVLDATTGELEEQCNYLAEDESEIPGHGGRAYGWFGATDLDGDNRPEFVIIEDFIRYATVIARRDGKLERLWLKVWEPKTSDGHFPDPKTTVVVRVNPEPVQEVDGDGYKEIVVSVFNASGDGRWHVLVIEPLSGAVKYDLPSQFLIGLRDADGNGIADLFCTAVESGPRIPEPAELSIVSFNGRKAARLWQLDGAAFVTYELGHFPPNVNSGAALGGRTILCGPITPGQPNVFFTRKTIDSAAGQTELGCWQTDSQGAFRTIAAWTGPRLEPLATRGAESGKPCILLKTASFDKEVATLHCLDQKAEVQVLTSDRVPAPVSPVVVGRPQPGALPIVVIEGPNETVEAFRPTPDGKTRQLWRTAGRGMTCNNYREGVLLADLTGDGCPAVVVGTRGPRDCARLAVLDAASGQTRWTRDFDDFPGPPPPWNVPGLMYWQGGYFRDPNRMDLLVQLRRVGGESYLLDGRSGEVLWRQARGRTGRDFGRAWMAMVDYDGDGLDDILNIYPDMFCVARGRDGELLLAEESHKYVDVYAYYSDMLVACFSTPGEPQVLYANEFVTAMLTVRGQRLWKIEHPHPAGWRNQAAWGDVDGDGRFELLFPGAMGDQGREFQCRDAATAALKWRIPIPDQPLTFPAVADIDGDGRDECIFTMDTTLYAVGAAKGNAAEGAPPLDAQFAKHRGPGYDCRRRRKWHGPDRRHLR